MLLFFIIQLFYLLVKFVETD